MLILDTDVLSFLRRPDRMPGLTGWLARVDERQVFLSVITLGEIERGITRQEQVNPPFAAALRVWCDGLVAQFADRILDFDRDAALHWGRLSARIGHGNSDLMIAATALAHDATVVTRNVQDFLPTGARVECPV